MVFAQCQKYGGVWESLQKAFSLTFFPTPQVVKLRREVICFEQQKTESLGLHGQDL
jgi:hypothetical protein